MSGLSASYTDILVDKLNKVDAALDAIPRLQENSDTIKAYMPWATVALGVIGVGLVLFAARTMK